tara:strand:- start:50 stop:208 length:159 start_codon:yes stop_codon:yes gene_type:complete
MGKLMSKIENIYKERLLDYERDIADLIQIIERLTKKQQSTRKKVEGLKHGSN